MLFARASCPEAGGREQEQAQARAAAAAASSFGEAWGLPLGRLALRQERHTSRDPVDRDEAVACVARLLGWYLAGGGGGGAAHFFMVQGCRLRKVLRGGAGRTLYAARRRSLRGKASSAPAKPAALPAQAWRAPLLSRCWGGLSGWFVVLGERDAPRSRCAGLSRRTLRFASKGSAETELPWS